MVATQIFYLPEVDLLHKSKYLGLLVPPNTQHFTVKFKQNMNTF